MKNKIVVFWFRRDLRLHDNTGLFHALSSGFDVLPIFIFDKNILQQLENPQDRRVDYIHQALIKINLQLQKTGSRLQTFYDRPIDVFISLADTYDIQAVYANRDYEPAAIQRDKNVHAFFAAQNIAFKAYKDQVIFDKKDIVKNDQTPYTVYTPYAKKWRATLTPAHYQPRSYSLSNFYPQKFADIYTLPDIGFQKTDFRFTEPTLDQSIINDYDKYRDFPAMQHTTQLGTALRFGTISIRECVNFALQHNQTWLSELIWRDFFMQILYHFPKVVHHAFKAKYDAIEWRNNETEFNLWCEGKTGYPIVDAGMRQLNQTGYMHNRVRMIVASFLCKHLLIDWRWGEAYFAQKLNDYDLSANNGNWQWAAGSGCDAAPYFRIFNPTTQTEKFDKQLAYVKKWVPEYNTPIYPAPIVEHRMARARALEVYKKAVKSD